MFSVVLPGKVAVSSILDSLPEGWVRVDCRPLVDGPGNSPELIDSILDEALKQIHAGAKVCFVCDYGQSRSNLLAALAVVRLEDVGLDEAVDGVRRNHPDSMIKPAMLGTLRPIPESGGAPASTRRWAITGGRGLIGSALEPRLADGGDNVRSYSRDLHAGYLDGPRALSELFAGDGITDVVHLAYPKPYNSYESSKEALVQLVSLVESCISEGIILHHVSTWAVFDGSTEPVASEAVRPDPHSLYAQAKFLMERFVSMQREHFGLRSRIYRLPGILDERNAQPRFLRYFADCVRKREPITIHGFRNGSAAVPLATLEGCVGEFSGLLRSPSATGPLTHVARCSSSPKVAEIASSLCERHGIGLVTTPVDRVVFSGEFVTERETPERDTRQPAGFSLDRFIDSLLA